MPVTPYTIAPSETPATLVATGTDGPSAALIEAVLTTITGSGGVMLPTDYPPPGWYADGSGVNTVQITLINASGVNINVYTPDNNVRFVMQPNTSARFEPGGQSTFAVIELY